MKPENSTFEMEQSDPPPMQEVEFALILSQMIEAVRADPAQLRTAVYEFARSKLNNEVSWANEAEQERARLALETAIKGVEDFSVRRDDRERLLPPPSSATPQIAPPAPVRHTAVQVEVLPPVHVSESWERPRYTPRREKRAESKFLSPLGRLAAGLLIAGVLAGGAIYGQRNNIFQAPKGTMAAKPSVADRPANTQVSEAAAPEAAAPPQKPPFPLPTLYGVYALAGDTVKEMSLMFEPVPDKRIRISSPIDRPSTLTLPDGHVRFIIYRRDIATGVPERVDVRVVATVKRAMAFDPKGGRRFVPVNNEWSMRNATYELRVRPVPQSPDMLLIESENPDFKLAPGRYALILRNQGYDFTIAGDANDPVQCLERTDAVNGSFLSDCSGSPG